MNMNTYYCKYNAVWIYARKRNSGCNIYCEENAGEISKGREVVYMFLSTYITYKSSKAITTGAVFMTPLLVRFVLNLVFFWVGSRMVSNKKCTV